MKSILKVRKYLREILWTLLVTIRGGYLRKILKMDIEYPSNRLNLRILPNEKSPVLSCSEYLKKYLLFYIIKIQIEPNPFD